jgi:hypothetical protein
LPQHEVIDVFRLYAAYQGQTAGSADLYYSKFNSMLSVMKCSVYLAETAISDLFLVSLSKRFFLTGVLPVRIAPSVVSVLYRLEGEHPDYDSSIPSVYFRHMYVPEFVPV